MEFIFSLSIATILICLPIVITLIADRKTKARCENFVREMRLLRDSDYCIALHELDREFPSVKKE